MEMFFAGLFGLLIGAATIPLAHPTGKIGNLLLPALGGAVALGYWAVATWLTQLPGFSWLAYDATWIWVLLVAIVAITCILVARILPARRAIDDQDLLDRLSHVGRAEV